MSQLPGTPGNPGNTPAQEKPSFESALEQLQSAVRRLESGELSLEESLKQFEAGVKLTRSCQEYLTTAEQRVEMLIKANNATGEVELQPFAPSQKN